MMKFGCREFPVDLTKTKNEAIQEKKQYDMQ